MNPVDEFARIRVAIQTLETRAKILRDSFLRPDARLRSNGFEVIVRCQTRRVFQKDWLPDSILNDPGYWSESVSQIVTVSPLTPMVATSPIPKVVDDFDLIEPFQDKPCAFKTGCSTAVPAYSYHPASPHAPPSTDPRV